MVENQNSEDIRTASVEKVLEPLVTQIALLITRNDSAGRPKGLSQNKSIILDLIKNSIGDLLRRAEDITLECPDVVDNFRVALSEVQNIGRHFHHSVSLFLDNPVDEEAHAELLRASRSLLSSATRILILADLVDVNQLHSCLENIKGDAECIGILTDESEFSRLCAVLEGHVDTLENLLKCRSQDLLDARQRNDLNCSHSTLTMACEMIVTATKATFRYPDLATLKANREFAVHLAREAVNRLGCACDATYAPPVLPSLQGQAVSRLMQEVVKSAEAGVEKTESWNSIFFQSNVRKLSAEIAALTESAGLADYFQAGIARCIHQLSEAVDQFIEAWDYETPNGLQIYVETMKQSCSRIRSFISQAALTLCSTIYITNDSVLSQIEEAAKCANEEKLVAAVTEIQTAKENFTLFAQAYRNMVKFLLENIDEVTDVIDFLDAQDRLLQEDIRKCQAKAEGSQTTGIMGSSRNLTARCTRAVKYILAKLENSEGSIENAEQTRTVLENIKENLVPQFLEATRAVCRSLKARSGSPDTGAIRRMGEAIRSAFGGLRPILEGLNQDRGEISSAVPDASLEMQPSTPSLPPPPPPPQQQPLNMKETQQSSASDEIIDKFRSSQSIQVQPPKGLNPNLNPLINRFNKERTSLMHHVRKLGGTGKDDLMSLVRTISFRLSEIVNYLTEPKKSAVSTETCLVQAAREISLMAAQLNGYCEKIARNFSDLKTRQNLFVSLKNINLFSHELAVMSRVKADLMNLNTEICLDNDESLIQSARNLLQAIKHALGDIRLIVEQKRVRSASSTLPPVPPKPYSRRTSTISSASPLSSYGVKIERTFDLSY
ncbi:unnamed protein product [Hymenolepis diminuta]|uniref:Vinculin n=1 Tax=Hymenolepis diminuta TaxID=6216 RepID=A0A564YH35_HYMDI|nr:unnamed protein product [Hymenolepis diminuta]